MQLKYAKMKGDWQEIQFIIKICRNYKRKMVVFKFSESA